MQNPPAPTPDAGAPPSPPPIPAPPPDAGPPVAGAPPGSTEPPRGTDEDPTPGRVTYMPIIDSSFDKEDIVDDHPAGSDFDYHDRIDYHPVP
jgi:hypothetical protein